MRVNAGTVAVTVANLRGVHTDVVRAQREVLVAAGGVLHRGIRANLSLRDHSLADLARLGHPYARRHAGIQVHRSRPYVVHRQSGGLLSALRASVLAPGDRYGVWLDPSVARHALFVVAGTRVMHGRDVMWRTAEQRDVRVGMMRAVVRVLGAELRTKAAVRFSRARGAAPPRLGV